MIGVDFFNFFSNFTVAACDDTAYFFAGCIHDCLNQDDDDCLMRIMIARSEVNCKNYFQFAFNLYFCFAS